MTDEAQAAVADEAADAPPPDADVADETAQAEAAPAKAEKAKSNGAEKSAPEPEKSYWPEDWREHVASNLASDDEKVAKKELKRLQRIADPAGLYGMYRDLEAKFSEGGLIKKPGKDASEEDIGAYRKAMGVPEKPEAYLENLKLENDAILGEDDKPIAAAFAEALHAVNAPQEVMDVMVNRYFALQEEQMAALDQADEQFHVDSTRALKEEWGAKMEGYKNAIGNAYASVGHGDVLGLIAGSRAPDGRLLGDHPDYIKAQAALALAVNPLYSVTEQGEGSVETAEAELARIRMFRKTNKREYFKDTAMQEREQQLIEALQAPRAR